MREHSNVFHAVAISLHCFHYFFNFQVLLFHILMAHDDDDDGEKKIHFIANSRHVFSSQYLVALSVLIEILCSFSRNLKKHKNSI